jgi:hypothetical protein
LNNRMLRTLAILAFLQILSAELFPQRIENVVSEVSGTDILIYYDLADLPDNQPVFVRVFMSTDEGITYGEPLKSVTGDVGMVVGPGSRKKIIWDVFSEVDELVSESVRFMVKADLLLSGQQREPFRPGYQAGVSAHLGSKMQLSSYGYNLKAAIRLKQFGLGIRGEYYRSHETPPGEAFYDRITGFSGAAFAEYDFIRNTRYSVYPFLLIGQTKIEEQFDSGTSNYAGYSIYYSAGAGFDLRLMKYLFLGAEIEYIMAPVIDIDDQAGDSVVDRIIVDGIWAGIGLKFLIQP